MAASCSDVVMKVCIKGLKVECFRKIISKLKLLAYHLTDSRVPQFGNHCFKGLKWVGQYKGHFTSSRFYQFG